MFARLKSQTCQDSFVSSYKTLCPLVILSTLTGLLPLMHCVHAYWLHFEQWALWLWFGVPHLWDAMCDCISSYFNPDHQHYTNEAQKAETVLSVVINLHIYTWIFIYSYVKHSIVLSKSFRSHLIFCALNISRLWWVEYKIYFVHQYEMCTCTDNCNIYFVCISKEKYTFPV